MLKKRLRCFYRIRSSKSAINILMICGLLTLFIQVCIFLIILYASEREFQWPWFTSDSVFSDPIDDLDIIKQIFTDFGLSLIVVDDSFLSLLQTNKNRHRSLSIYDCEVCEYLKHHTFHLAVDKVVDKEVFLI